jgi:protein-S-isoprenylcysteine O-methyltransferase Ste14
MSTIPSRIVKVASAPRRRPAAAVLDHGERLLVLGLYAWLVYRILAAYAVEGGAANLLLLPSEGLVVFFTLVRRGTRDISGRTIDWLLAFGATTAPLLASPAQGGKLLVLQAVAATIMLSGIMVQVHAKLVLGRSFGCVAANRGVKLSGPYRFLRHPMYAGYLLTHVGFLLANLSAWNIGIYLMCYCLQVPRLLAEERLLRSDDRYRKYLRTVRYRLIPGVF